MPEVGILYVYLMIPVHSLDGKMTSKRIPILSEPATLQQSRGLVADVKGMHPGELRSFIRWEWMIGG